jgi:CRP-like cAMP-binding protein
MLPHFSGAPLLDRQGGPIEQAGGLCCAQQEAELIVTDDELARAVRRIIFVNTRQGSGPLDSRTLYRLWQSTGLRRSELMTGLRMLIDAGALEVEQRGRISRYQLAQAHRRAGDSVPVTTLPGAHRKAAPARHGNASGPVRHGLRDAHEDESALPAEPRKMPENRLLRSLPSRERKALKAELELVPMPAGRVLWEKGEHVRFFYFPVDCVLSISHELGDGSSSEVATVGSEGMMDALVLLGNDVAARRALVSLPGYAYRLPVDSLRLAFSSSGAVQHELLRYIRVLFLQMAQLAACNRHHPVEQQLCRVLLSSSDRIRSRTLNTTQDTLAGILGVRGESIAEAIGKLKHAGLINAQHGSLVVLDREGLQERACECYTMIRGEYQHLGEATRPARGAARAAGAADRHGQLA